MTFPNGSKHLLFSLVERQADRQGRSPDRHFAHLANIGEELCELEETRQSKLRLCDIGISLGELITIIM